MSRRRIVLGAIGGDRQEACAIELGSAAARAGCIVLTGGGDPTDAKRHPDEVKNAVIQGALSVDASARFIGILPTAPQLIAWRRSSPGGLLLETGLPHNVRNLINGVTPDVLVVFGGGAGTLAEAAFAEAAGKTLFFYGTGEKGPALVRLRKNLRKYFVDGAQDNIRAFLDEPLKVWPEIAGRTRTADELIRLLGRRLDQASNWTSSADDLVRACCAPFDPPADLPSTGFPGLPGDASSRQRFERAIEEIST